MDNDCILPELFQGLLFYKGQIMSQYLQPQTRRPEQLELVANLYIHGINVCPVVDQKCKVCAEIVFNESNLR